MSDQVVITSLQVANFKRVKALALAPSSAGLTIVGGRNGQGKTSCLDAIAWALGGAKFEPSSAKRDESLNPAEISLTLSNGLTVERRGKNGSLYVTDPSGAKYGQSLLDAFVSQFAMNLPKFMNASNAEKAQILLQILGIGDELKVLEQEEKAYYDSRRAIGQIADKKKKYADELPEYADAPDTAISVSDLIQQQQDILGRNAENEGKRRNVEAIRASVAMERKSLEQTASRADELRRQLLEAEAEIHRLSERIEALVGDLATAEKSAEQLVDESTAELEASLANIEAINAQVAANQQKAQAHDEAQEYQGQYDGFTEQIKKTRAARLALLEGANLPLPGLAVEDGTLMYQTKAWDCMSGSEQLRVAVAIVRRLNPQCGFVLMDRLEQLDMKTLGEFGAWAASEGLQIIATRVSTGEECTIVIEDGLPVGKTYADVTTGVTASPKGEEFKWE